METGPLTYEHAVPYANLIFAAGHLDETVAVDEKFRAIEPLAMFHSRSVQWDYVAARRYDEAEAEYRRSLALEGNHSSPTFAAFLRTLARKNVDLEALRALHHQVLQNIPDPDPPFFRDFGAVLHDRDAMLAVLYKAAEDSVYQGGNGGLWLLADALGDADLAAAAMREALQGTKGFREGHMDYLSYWTLWMAPYSDLRSHPDFKQLLIDTGLVDYWRQTGKWGDGCRPVGADDFQCD